MTLSPSVLRHRSAQVFSGLKPLLPYAFLGFLALIVLASISPHQRPLPSTDSSVFLYMGKRILQGDVPYQDVWDHKGPLIYYIDALGLLIADGSRWGVWLLQLLFVAGSVMLGFRLMRAVFGYHPAFFASVVWLVTLVGVLNFGNLTEEYSLLFQFGALWFFWRALDSADQRHYWGVGLMGALAFLLRPNLAGTAAAIGLYLLVRYALKREKNADQALLIAAGGLLLPLAVTALYFGYNGALADMLDQVFRYNLLYSDTSWASRIETVFFALAHLGLLAVLGVASWLYTFSAGSGDLQSSRAVFMKAMLWVLPLDVLLMALSGYQFDYYLMALLPIFAVFLARLFSAMLGSLNPGQKRGLTLSLVAAVLAVPLFNLLPAFMGTVQSAMQNGGVPVVVVSSEHGLTQAIEYLDKISDPGEEILFLGHHVTLNWFTDHPSPSRYVYQSQLFNSKYVQPAMIEEFLDDLRNSRALVVDTLGSHAFRDEIEVELETLPEIIRPVYAYLQENYTLVKDLDGPRWLVYEYTGPE